VWWKAILRGFWFSTLATLATDTPFICMILYREGYWWSSDLFPSQVSSQNLVSSPLPMVRELLKKLFFDLHYSLLERRIWRFHSHLGKRFWMEILVSP
jgi:hypothetical protein